ncbi:rhamnulokinase [Meiothermus granaticius]|uniref:L-Rhamnulokinase n=1 Tax=Meiothermus granaticius NBRC 107808 TaxID=1227551 RepID=A0A399F9E4_9DEIN|nr:rhamnulokinase family protein [Meiothermus granaticius]RIH91532.1 L-Rhamnulokinase [Meiothermus granaticius NBRC 107808]GEM88265.1 carbohydrate kinase [Meiothermus granaticius NBRC 107808]
MPSYHLAIDLGASGGRVALGRLEGERLEVEVLHRFPNGPVELPGGLYWDVLGLWREVGHGLSLAAERASGPIASLGVDSWGVDFALLDEYGLLMDGLRHYRDPRTEGQMERAFARMSREEIYRTTGLQFMPINSLYQLLATEERSPGVLARAQHFLMVPDLLHYWLTGRAVCERTNASTTQLFDPTQGDWAWGLIQAMGLPQAMLGPLVEPGSRLGPLLPPWASRWGLRDAEVIAPGTHDTASAVAAIPAEGEGWAYISSGTWSLVGLETAQPHITPQTLALNLTNEAGVHGTTRLLKNVMGLWILQECRRSWGDPEWPQLYAEAEAVCPRGSLGAYIDPDHPSFLHAGSDMPQRVAVYCERTAQPLPQGRGAVVRCVLESLALKYRWVLEGLERVTGQTLHTLHVVGGGSQIDLLNRLIAAATGRAVIAGPVEATLMGNLLVQAEGCGVLEPQQRRRVVAASSTLRRYAPEHFSDWITPYMRFAELIAGQN